MTKKGFDLDCHTGTAWKHRRQYNPESAVAVLVYPERKNAAIKTAYLLQVIANYNLVKMVIWLNDADTVYQEYA